MARLQILTAMVYLALTFNLTTGSTMTSREKTCRTLCGMDPIPPSAKLEYERAKAKAIVQQKIQTGETMRFLRQLRSIIASGQKAARNISTTRRIEVNDRMRVLRQIPVPPPPPPAPPAPRKLTLPMALQIRPAVQVAQPLTGTLVQYQNELGQMVSALQMAPSVPVVSQQLQQIQIPQTLPFPYNIQPAPMSQPFILTPSGQVIQPPAPVSQPLMLTPSGQLIQAPGPVPVQVPVPAPAPVKVPFVRPRPRFRWDRPLLSKRVMEQPDAELEKYKATQIATWLQMARWMEALQRSVEERARHPILPVMVEVPVRVPMVIQSPAPRPPPSPTPPEWMVYQLEQYFRANPFANPVPVQLGRKIYWVASTRSPLDGQLILNFRS